MMNKSQQAQTRVMARFSLLCMQQGYSKTTMRQLAQACGMSRGHIAFYYKTKADLLLALINAFSAQVDALIAGAQNPPAHAATRFFLRHLVLYYLIGSVDESYSIMAELADRADYLDKRVERAYNDLMAATTCLQPAVAKEEVFVGCLCAIRSIYPLIKYWRYKQWPLDHLRLFQVFCDALITQSGLQILEQSRQDALHWFTASNKSVLLARVGDLRAFIIGAAAD